MYTQEDFLRETEEHKREMQKRLKESRGRENGSLESVDPAAGVRVEVDEYGGVLSFLNNLQFKLPDGSYRETVEGIAKFDKRRFEKRIERMREFFADIDRFITEEVGLGIEDAKKLSSEIKNKKDNRILVENKELLSKIYVKMRDLGYTHEELTK